MYLRFLLSVLISLDDKKEFIVFLNSLRNLHLQNTSVLPDNQKQLIARLQLLELVPTAMAL
jgi:hypothetical protein